MNTQNLQSLHHCFDHLREKLRATKYTSAEFADYMHTGGIGYGTTWRRTFDLETAKGNTARKALQVQIDRTPLGLYNVNSYIL